MARKRRTPEEAAHWKALRVRVLRRDQNTCQKCGTHDSLLVHTVDNSRFGHELMQDVETWCSNCHSRHNNERAKEPRRKFRNGGKCPPKKQRQPPSPKPLTNAQAARRQKQLERTQENREAQWRWDHAIPKARKHAMRETMPAMTASRRQEMLDRIDSLEKPKEKVFVRRPKAQLTTNAVP